MNENVHDTYGYELTTFFDVLGQKLDSHDDAMRHLDRFVSSRFNVVDIIGPDENSFSNLFRELLDPTGVHGQGRRFLDAFLARLDRPGPFTGDPRGVHREWSTSYLAHSVRRIDLLVDFGTAGLAIENKLWAREQENQVQDYQHDLTRRYGAHFCLVFLTVDGHPPDTQATVTEGALQLMSYRTDVPDWLDACIQTCESDKFRWFLRDLRDHIQHRFPPLLTPEANDDHD